MLTIRKARLADLRAITAIYNEAITTTVAAFDTEAKTEAEQKIWFANHGPRRPIIVAELDKAVVGWASLSDWSHKDGYRNTAENSVFVKEGYRSRGIGRKLLESLLEEGKKAGLHTVIARITEGNRESIHLHRSAGFEEIGLMREVGQKFGRRLDVHVLQIIFPTKG